MGDGLESVMLGFISSILPAGNTICEKLRENSKTAYFYQETIKSGHGGYKKLRVYEIPACRKGCVAFIGDNVGIDCCQICEEVNDIKLNQSIYYFPFSDRITKILYSDLRKLLFYSRIRRPSAENFSMMVKTTNGLKIKWIKLGLYLVCL